MAELNIGNFKKNLKVDESTGEDSGVEVMGGEEPTGTEPTGDEPTPQGEEPTGAEPTEETNTEPSTEGGEETIKPEDNEPSGSSLKPEENPLPEGQSQVESKSTEAEINDDAVAKYLSEKLGREVNIEDLAKEREENPLDSDPYMKEVYEWRKKTGRPIEDFIKFQKDFSEVGDLEVAREFLQLEYPNSTPEEINLELSKFTTSEDDLDDEVAQKNWELKKLATKGRAELEKLKANLSEPSQISLPKDIQEKVSFADQLKSQIEANKKEQEDYTQGIERTAQAVDKISMDLGDGTKLDYLVSEDVRKEIPKMIAEMPHWKNEDGSWNHQAVVEDGLKIRNHQDMIKLAYEQGLSKGKDELIRETKNTNLNDTGSSAQPEKPTSKPVYEDEEGSKEIKVRFGKK